MALGPIRELKSQFCETRTEKTMTQEHFDTRKNAQNKSSLAGNVPAKSERLAALQMPPGRTYSTLF